MRTELRRMVIFCIVALFLIWLAFKKVKSDRAKRLQTLAAKMSKDDVKGDGVPIVPGSLRRTDVPADRIVIMNGSERKAYEQQAQAALSFAEQLNLRIKTEFHRIETEDRIERARAITHGDFYRRLNSIMGNRQNSDPQRAIDLVELRHEVVVSATTPLAKKQFLKIIDRTYSSIKEPKTFQLIPTESGNLAVVPVY